MTPLMSVFVDIRFVQYSELFRFFTYFKLVFLKTPRFGQHSARISFIFLDFFFSSFFIFRNYLVKLRLRIGSLFSQKSLRMEYIDFFFNNADLSSFFNKSRLLSLSLNPWTNENQKFYRRVSFHRFMYISTYSLHRIRRVTAYRFSIYRKYQYRLTRFFLKVYKLSHIELLYQTYFKVQFLVERIFKITNTLFIPWLFQTGTILVNGNQLKNPNLILSPWDFLLIDITFFFFIQFKKNIIYRFHLIREFFFYFFKFRVRSRRRFPKQRALMIDRRVFRLRRLKSFFGIRFVQVCFQTFSFILLQISIFYLFFYNCFLTRFLPTRAIRSHNWKYLS